MSPSTSMAASIGRARTLLYVPGDRPDRFAKAAASGADLIVLDLEDAVEDAAKAGARHEVHRWLAEGGPGLVRVNSLGTPWHDDDLAMLAGEHRAVILPKVRGPRQAVSVLGRLPRGSCLVPIFETASGILAARDICVVPGVVRAIFGSADLASELGVDHTDRAALAWARSMVVLASAAAGIAPPLDGATTAIRDEKALIADVRDAAAMGFTGKSCLHPSQVPLARAELEPSAEDLRWAHDVLAAAHNGSPTDPHGDFIGKPIITRAHRILRSAAS